MFDFARILQDLADGMFDVTDNHRTTMGKGINPIKAREQARAMGLSYPDQEAYVRRMCDREDVQGFGN